MRAIFAIFLIAAPVSAQDLAFSPADAETCLAYAEDEAARHLCVGFGADNCMERSSEGLTTFGMVNCLAQERDYWDLRLNEAYTSLIGWEAENDAEAKTAGSEATGHEMALRNAQRAWMTYRDALCLYSASRYGAGTAAGPARASCEMQLTGERALELEALLSEWVQ